MDAKITLSFRADVIQKAKVYAEKQGLSLSRIIENQLSRLIRDDAYHFDQFPISDWVYMAAEGDPEYHSTNKSSRRLRKDYQEGRRKRP